VSGDVITRSMIALTLAVTVIALAPEPATGQAMYPRDYPREKVATTWVKERATLSLYTPPRRTDGTPDMEGLWNGGGSGDELEAHDYIDVTTPPSESYIADPPDGRIPYLPWADAVRKKHRAGLARGWPGESGERMHVDPATFCLLGAAHFAYRGAFRILQGRDHVVMQTDWSHYYRVIPTDARPTIPATIQLYMGSSRGRWEGNTLVVDVTNNNGLTWLDTVGNFHSREARLIERWTRVAPDIIDYQLTIHDPKVFARPWTISFPLRRAANQAQEMWEHACVEGNQEPAEMRKLGFTPFTGVIPPQ